MYIFLPPKQFEFLMIENCIDICHKTKTNVFYKNP